MFDGRQRRLSTASGAKSDTVDEAAKSANTQ
jgi:hypothetical protein